MPPYWKNANTTHRASRHPRLLRNFLQCGTGNAHAPKNFQRGIQQMLACFLCFLLGFSHKRLSVCDCIDFDNKMRKYG